MSAAHELFLRHEGAACENCYQPSRELWFCTVCSEIQCRRCKENVHMPGTRRGAHHLEVVDPPLPMLITPLFRAIHIAAIAFIISSVVADVIRGDVHNRLHGGAGHLISLECPLVSRLRKVTLVDSLVYHYFKGYWVQVCDAEDSWWRLISDTWARALVSGTDTWYLFALQLRSAMLPVALIVTLVIPTFCAASAAAFVLVYLAEQAFMPTVLSRPGGNDVVRSTCHFMAPLTRTAFAPFWFAANLAHHAPVAVLLSRIRLFVVRSTSSASSPHSHHGLSARFPPATRVTNPDGSPAEPFDAFKTQFSRYFGFFYHQLRALTDFFVIGCLSTVTAVRFMCLWKPPFVRIVLKAFGLQAKAELSADTLTVEPVSSALHAFAGLLLPNVVVSPESIPHYVFLASIACMCISYYLGERAIEQRDRAPAVAAMPPPPPVA
ncbi:hypothetical protein DIPPA_19312 [Diplonema papillatum]|nr:hypothetical protein DIPPA_19312 [Diplonema papillatum]|eukprot:gene15390-23531_t